MAERAKAKKRTTPRRKPTETSSFGVSGRQSHNSAKYYARALGHAQVSDDVTVVRPKNEVLDQLYCHSSEKMRELPANSVGLMVTSPEYHVGKALRTSEPVLTPTGWVKIGELVAGDQVVALDGTPTTVTGVYPQGSRQLWRVTFDDGAFVDVDSDHLWRMQTYNDQVRRPDRWRVLSTAEMLSQWGPRPVGPRAPRIPSVAPIAMPTASLPVNPYVLGVILGDGTVIEGGYVRVSLGRGSEGVLQALSSVYGMVVSPYTDRDSYGLPGLGAAMRDLEIDGVGVPNKFAPTRALFGDAEQRLALLQGLMDTDGSCSSGHTEFSSSSPALVDAVEFLVQSLGGKARRLRPRIPVFKYKGERRYGRLSRRLYITIAVCPFLHHEQRRSAWHAGRAWRRTIDRRILRSIEPVDVDDATCISVEHADGCFVTRGCVVTHNSYEDPNESIADYLALLHRVLKETYRVLEPGGRAAINVANLGRKPYVQLADIVAGIATNIGFLARGEIIWVKGEGASGNIAVGSFAQPSAPCLRDVHEYVLVFQKGRWERAIHWKQRKARDLPWEATISKEDFLAWTLSIWRIQPESAKRVGHPAPFPVELPRRLIELYTWADDVVLDPFMGAGATAVAAVKTGRRYVGYDIEQSYIDRAQKRIDQERGDGQA